LKTQTRFAFATTLILAIGVIALSQVSRFTPSSNSDSVETLSDQVHAQVSKKPDVLPADAITVATGSAFSCSGEVNFNNQDLGAVASELSQSRDPEHVLMAALYGQDPTDEAGVHKMTRALRSDPDNRLITWNFLQSCSQFPDTQVCLNHEIEKRAIEVDGSNGQLWSRIAGYRVKRGDMQGALEALSKAAVAPRFSDYRMEHIELFERGLAAAGNLSYRDRIVQAIGMQAALVSNEFYVMNGCKTMAPESAEWLSLCIRIGDRLESEGNSIYSIASGQSLQKKMYVISGDNEKEALVVERLDTTTQHMTQGISEDGQVLLWRDDHVLAQYISELATHGEIRALTFLSNEVERLENLEGYDPCLL
jgi:hypothetical protein